MHKVVFSEAIKKSYLYKAFNDICEDLRSSIVEYFYNIWANNVKVCRTLVALYVFENLSEDEIVRLIRVDATVNALDDILDIPRLDEKRGKYARPIYIRTILDMLSKMDSLANRYFELIGRNVFDSEWRSQKETIKDPIDYLIEHYVMDAYDIWYFIALPAYNRLPREDAEKIITMGILYRAVWLIRDHLSDLKEDRELGVYTPVRKVIEQSNHLSINEAIKCIIEKFENIYSTLSVNIRKYGDKLKDLLNEELNYITKIINCKI